MVVFYDLRVFSQCFSISSDMESMLHSHPSQNWKSTVVLKLKGKVDRGLIFENKDTSKSFFLYIKKEI